MTGIYVELMCLMSVTHTLIISISFQSFLKGYDEINVQLTSIAIADRGCNLGIAHGHQFDMALIWPRMTCGRVDPRSDPDRVRRFPGGRGLAA